MNSRWKTEYRNMVRQSRKHTESESESFEDYIQDGEICGIIRIIPKFNILIKEWIEEYYE